MKKEAFLRGLLGFPLGIAIGHGISIIISLRWGQGFYSPCVPALVETMGSEINAVILQTLLSGLLGTAFGASSVIWKMEQWNIAKQTGIYFLITTCAMLPVAYITNWMEHSVWGFLGYFVIFFVIFVLVWFLQYCIWKNKIQKMNARLKK